MTDVRKSFLLSFADSYLALVLQIASTVIIARLLTPAEIGVFAIAAVFSALASTFRDFGVAEYLIQAPDVTTRRLRAALMMNILIAWSMALLLVAGAPSAAAFYREPVVGDVMRVLALNFLLVPFGAVVQAYFRRELNYKPIVIANAASSVAVFAVSVLLALEGFGAMSLAWSSFAGIVVTVLVTTWLRPRDFPRRPSFEGLAEVFHFGKFASGIYIAAQLGKGAPELVIGRVHGAADVGIFSRANGLIEMLNRLLLKPVMQVCLPYFARASRETGELAPSYVRSVAMLTAVGWPFLGYLAVLAYAVIRLVYGVQWMAAVPLAQILCLACAIEMLFLLSREALLAVGEARRANALQLQIVVLQVAGIALVIPFGLAGAAWGLAAAAAGGFALSQWHLARATALHTPTLLRACLPSLALAAWTTVPLVLITQAVPVGESNFVAYAVGGGLLVALAWLVGLRVLRHPLWDEVLRVVQRLAARGAAA